ncbi:MAG: glycosyltransferase, partial [Bacilli bacterium]|nr:glycosyltransferase [Bacilli bacterium]
MHHFFARLNPLYIDKLYDLNYNKFTSDKIRLIFIGSIDSRKGLVLMLEALKQLPEEAKKSIVLDVLGAGALENKLKAWSTENGISD